MTATTTTIAAVLKEQWDPNSVRELFYDNCPLYALLKKKDNLGGEGVSKVLRYASHAGGSAVFATAQANKRSNAYAKFQLTRAKDYVVGSIETEAIRAASGKEEALVDIVEAELNGMSAHHRVSVCGALYRNGGGAIGRISSGEGTNTIVLATPDDIVNFDVGMRLDGSTADGTSGAVIAGGTANRIVAIDRDAGSITNTGANWNAATGINGIAATNYLFRAGDFGAKLKGLDAWVPSSAPGATAFFGVDRSVDTVRLGGVRVAAQGSIEETLLKGMAMVFREGGKTSHIFMNYEDFRLLVISLGNKQTIDVKTDMPSVGFKAVEIVGPGGTAKVMADPFCPRSVAYGLQLDTWCLHHMGAIGSTLDEDGNPYLRESSADAIEIRMASFFQLGCDAPGFNFRAALPSALAA